VSDAEQHPSQQLDDIVHQRVRLGILALLAEADRADFGFLKDRLDLTDGNLSRHLRVLGEAGYVAITKEFEGRRTRTWVVATQDGQTALGDHLAALQQIIDLATGEGA